MAIASIYFRLVYLFIDIFVNLAKISLALVCFNGYADWFSGVYEQ